VNDIKPVTEPTHSLQIYLFPVQFNWIIDRLLISMILGCLKTAHGNPWNAIVTRILYSQ